MGFNLARADTRAANAADPRHGAAYTTEVVTLWYRAPELLLGETSYDEGVDLWSAGAVFAEMASSRPVLPGDSEIDQLLRTFRLLGTPNEDEWPGLSRLPDFSATFPKWQAQPLREALPLKPEQLSDEGLELLERLLVCVPSERIDATSALKHPYLAL